LIYINPAHREGRGGRSGWCDPGISHLCYA